MEIAKYVWYREYVLRKVGCLGYDPNLLKTLSIPLRNLQDLLTYEHYISIILSRRWYYAGIDTSGTDRALLGERFRLAMKLKGEEREIALLDVLNDADNFAGHAVSLEFSFSLAERIRDSLQVVHGSSKVIQLASEKCERLRNCLSETPAEDFTLPDRFHAPHSLGDYRGKAILIHYWGSWCGNCIDALPWLQEFEQTYATDTNLVCISVAFEKQGFDHWKDFVIAHQLKDIELYSAENNLVRDRSKPFGFQWVEWVPTYVVLDRNGRLISSDDSSPHSKQLKQNILKAERN